MEDMRGVGDFLKLTACHVREPPRIQEVIGPAWRYCHIPCAVGLVR